MLDKEWRQRSREVSNAQFLSNTEITVFKTMQNQQGCKNI